MSGVPIERLPSDTNTGRVICALPNVVASVGYSFTPWVASPAATVDDPNLVTRIFESCGVCDEVESEDHLDDLTGLSGSGPG
jgi:pyrroline-5-carboxylate reductase